MSQHGENAAGPDAYHVPVMVDEVLSYLLVNPDGLYVDATVGGGGHTSALLRRLQAGARIIGIDADPEAISQARTRLGADPRVNIVHGRFSAIASIAQQQHISRCDGIFADLGLSSHQIDSPARGFSYLQEGPLDMRMNPQAGKSATALLDQLDAETLAKILFEYGEERYARRIARAILAAHRTSKTWSTRRLAAVVEKTLPARNRIKSLARVFQALRIAVNDELAELFEFLPPAFALLKSGGRLVVISYHSLEDRLVKRFIAERVKGCICPPESPVCTCGRTPEARALTRKPVRPRREENAANPRARSAKLRVLEKLAD